MIWRTRGRGNVGSMWQSTVAPVVSSSQEQQNEVLNAGYHFRSCIQTKPTSSVHRMAPESLLPWISSSSSYNSDHAELGSSLLPLLSGSQSVTPTEALNSSCNISAFTVGNEFPVLTSVIISQNLSRQNMKAGSDPCSGLSSKDRMTAYHVSESGPSNVFQDAYVNHEKSEFLKPGMHQNLFSNETEVVFPSVRVGCLNGSIPSNAWKIRNGQNTGVLHKSDPYTSCLSSSITTGSPRVFCLNLSGDLLLSNNGLLGVVCSCHGIHMSIAKFSEHSGLCNMNPGVAVRLDSGETIAHWRKAYFHRYGIKIPEDHCGWDWPEGFSVTAGPMKHCTTVPGVSKNSDHNNQDGPTATVQTFDLRNKTLYSNNFHMVQKLTNQFAHDEKHRNTQECVGSSTRNNMHSVAKDHRMMYSTPEGSRMPNLAGVKGPDNVRQHLPPYILPITKNGDPSVLHTHLQNLETLGKNIDIGQNFHSFVQRDIVSSNVELRLGQPSQQGQCSGSSSQSAFGSNITGTHGQPQNTFFLEQQVPRSHSKPVEDRRQLNYLDNYLSGFSRRTEQNQLDHVNQICGASNAVSNPFHIEQFKDNPAGGSLISRSVTHVNYPLEGRIHSKSTNDDINDSHAKVSRVHSEYPIVKPGQFVFPLVGGEASQIGFSSNLPGFQENPGNGPSAIDSLQGAPGLTFGSHSNLKGRIWSLNGGESGSDYKVYATGKDESPALCHISGGMTEEPVRGNTCFGQASYAVQNGELIFSGSRPLNASMDFRRVQSTEVVPIGFSATSSHGNQSLPQFSKKENIGSVPSVMDRNVRISTMQHMSEIANKAISEQGVRNFCGKSQVNFSSSASDKRISEINYVSMLKTSDVATQSFLSSDKTKVPSVTEKVCNFSVPSQGNFSGKDAEVTYQFASDMQPTRQLFLRLGGTESISPLSKMGKCSQEMPAGHLPRKCSFTLQTNCPTGMHDKKGETILPECNDQEGNAGNMMATFSEKVDSFGPNENMKQGTKKAEVNSFLWRDVPKKVVEKSSLACVVNSVDLYNGNVECNAQKCVDDTADNVGSPKEQEMSNVSSGCSAPVVTQVSIDVNNKDSSTVDADDARYEGNAIVDEGSRIERCWSSDDGVDSDRNPKCSVFVSKLHSGHKRPSKPFLSKPNCSLIDELRLRDSLRLNMHKQSHTGTCNQENDASVQKSDRGYRIWKKRPVKWKKLTSSFSPSSVSVLHNDVSECAGNAELLSPSVKDMKMLSQCEQGNFEPCSCALGRIIKRKSIVSSSTDIFLDRDVFRIHHVEQEETDREMNSNGKSDNIEVTGRKRLRLGGADQVLEQTHMQASNSVDVEVAVKETPVNSHTCSNAWSISQRPERPIVCGKYGVIANANSLRPAKFVSLSKLLKAPRKCKATDTRELDLSPVKLSKKATIKERNRPFSKSSKTKEDKNSDLNPQHCVDEMKKECSIGSKEYDNLLHVMKRRRCHRNKIEPTPDGCQIVDLRCKYKEVRKRSLHELTTKDAADKTFVEELCNAKIPSRDDKYQGTLDLDVLCCVCGSSSKDENNSLLECSGCLIKVHQACYGISRVPKTHWYCRPCKTSSKSIVCVLCGYGGGAMTQALHSRNTVKSLLQAWNLIGESNSKNPGSSKSMENQIKMLSSTRSVGDNDPFLVIRPVHKGFSSLALCNKNLPQHKDSLNITSHAPVTVESNSITAGVFNSSVKQWVHMVCGLWTPGTRCPNVDTMSAFDVSGACTPESEEVCSICERPGGSCIRCRVVGCDITFHPWCAHQKGLLQSEVEGDYDESIGFYGRCLLHAMNQHDFKPDHYRLDCGDVDDGQKKSTCARTEGYKGRKRDGVHYNLPPKSGGSLSVPQEQLDAWIHINRQKPHKKGPLKLSSSQIEHDCRKEYARYKQSRGWEHLVVYKSGIHGLGLYTSQFIGRGAMVVEYVGEIVGLRVADKREAEYQSGKKLQYKSACYFFKIDKEYIIDATRQGGIARFVNHSCQPNCVAEIISVRNEKKVVFFAERDIYPGEEITYDYHFNHEDEGKKIPCYCNSKNCRRYLN